jgi:hypothetical protein
MAGKVAEGKLARELSTWAVWTFPLQEELTDEKGWEELHFPGARIGEERRRKKEGRKKKKEEIRNQK